MPQFDFTNWSVLVLSIFLSYISLFVIFIRAFIPRIVRFLKVQGKVLMD